MNSEARQSSKRAPNDESQDIEKEETPRRVPEEYFPEAH